MQLSTSSFKFALSKKQAFNLIFVACNVALLLAVTPVLSLLAFYVLAAIFVTIRSKVAGKAGSIVTAIGVVILTLALLYYHQSPLLFTGYADRVFLALFPAAWGAIKSQTLAAVGVSYCYLRTIYCITREDTGLWNFTKYYFFFPTFTSGPIIPPADFLSQNVNFSKDNVLSGLIRMLYGFLKFVLSSAVQIAAPLATETDQAWALHHYSPAMLWLGTFLSGFWLYLNFSGFSDIAIGMSRLVGIRVPENFNNPYAATSLTDFWRRWHITLANWLRANIFNPVTRLLLKRLSVQSIPVAIIPPVITMIVCGLWHGTIAAYFTWGLFHGVGLAADQLYKRFVESRLPDKFVKGRAYAAIGWLATHAYVTLGWAFFFPLPDPSLRQSLLFVKGLFGL